MKKKLLIPTIIAFSILSLAIYFLIISGAIFSILPYPSQPEKKYGEFAFELKYEINDEIKIINDIIVCEFDGYMKSSSAGRFRKWKSYIKNIGDRNLIEEYETSSIHIKLLDNRLNNDYDALGNKVLELYFFGGNGHYYMNDNLGHFDREAQKLNEINYLYQSPDGLIGSSCFNEDEAWHRYKIKLINWKVEGPI